MKIKQLGYLSVLMMIVSCSNPTPKTKEAVKEKQVSVIPAQKKAESQDTEKAQVQKETAFAGYRIEYGYVKFDPESFENPGYLRVLRNGKVLFTDKFTGEGEVRVKSLGYHALSGKKLVFTLNYGTEACDYTQVARYYVIDPDRKVSFLKKCYSSCGGDGYACHIFKHIFPEDSLGVLNAILFTEGFVYNEHDQEDKIDTTRISFSNSSFKLKQL